MHSEATVVISLTVLATVLPIIGAGGIMATGGIAAILLTTIAIRRRMVAASSIGVLLVVVLLLGLTGVGPQQILFGLAFVIYAMVISRLPWLRDAANWRVAGSFDLWQAAVGTAFGLVSGLGLWMWYEWRPEELVDLVDMVPAWSIWGLVPAGILFAIVNALLEEAVHRGVVQGSLERVLQPGVTTLTLQAAAFATLHFLTGIPRGFAGIGLAFAYGLVMGMLRRRSGGLAIPVVAHTITDLAIVGIALARVVG